MAKKAKADTKVPPAETEEERQSRWEADEERYLEIAEGAAMRSAMRVYKLMKSTEETNPEKAYDLVREQMVKEHTEDIELDKTLDPHGVRWRFLEDSVRHVVASAIYAVESDLSSEEVHPRCEAVVPTLYFAQVCSSFLLLSEASMQMEGYGVHTLNGVEHCRAMETITAWSEEDDKKMAAEAKKP
jgi:hypothetical protein